MGCDKRKVADCLLMLDLFCKGYNSTWRDHACAQGGFRFRCQAGEVRRDGEGDVD